MKSENPDQMLESLADLVAQKRRLLVDIESGTPAPCLRHKERSGFADALRDEILAREASREWIVRARARISQAQIMLSGLAEI